MPRRLEELLEQVRLAEQLGFSAITKSQHYSSSPFQEIQQIPFLSRAAAEVKNVKIITSITLLPLHKPLDLAEQLAALDLISGGNFVFGAGLGYREIEFRAFGTTQSERVHRLEENLKAIKRLWTEEAVSMHGSHFDLLEANCSLKPIQKPHPPIWLGANADVAIERAARLADSWMINPHNRVDTIIRQIETYKRALDKANKPFPKTLPISREMFVGKDRDDAIRQAQPYVEEKYKAYHKWGQDKQMPLGDNDLGLAFEELQDGRFLFGSVDEVADQIIALSKATGINQLGCPVQWVGMPQSHVIDQMHLMAKEVLPRVRQGL